MKKDFSSPRRPFLRLLALLLVALTGWPSPAHAQDNPRTEAFVWATTAFDGQIYQSGFIPPGIDTLYLMAGEESVLAPRQTLIYFWPLTNRYQADWLAMNQFVDGKLEISQDGKLVAAVDPVDYIVQYDASDMVGTRRLATGPEAQVASENFKKLQEQYRTDLADYYTAMQDYRQQVDKMVSEAMAAGKTIPESEYPKQPQPVPPFTLFSTELARGYEINLPVGMYNLSLHLSNGNTLPESKRQLVVFDQLEAGVAYNIVPKSRWTKPDTSKAPGGVIYSPPGTTVYLQPFRQGLFDEWAYEHMLDPQNDTARRGRNTWVTFDPLLDASLEVVATSQPRRELPLGAYHIAQSAGTGLGYEVLPFDPATMEQPSFQGYELPLENLSQAYRVRILDSQEKPVAGSERLVRVLNTRQGNILYGLSVLPALIGLGAVIARRRSVRKIKVEG